MTHAEERAVQRLAFRPNMEKILNTVKAGGAKFVDFSHSGRLIFDVPYKGHGGLTIRTVVEGDKSRVVTVLPNEFAREYQQRVTKTHKDSAAKTKRTFFKHFDDAEIA